MVYRIKRTAQFRDDLLAIYAFVHAQNPPAAERVSDAIERSVKSLASHPGIGRRWESPDDRLLGLRVQVVTPYRNYLVFYRRVGTEVHVYWVVQGARELDRLVSEIELDLEDS